MSGLILPIRTSSISNARSAWARVQVPAVGMIGIDFGYGFDPIGVYGSPSGWQTHFQFGKGF